MSTTRKTTLQPVGKNGLLDARETIYGRPPFWWLPILPLYILRMTFSRMDGYDLYSVTAAAPMTSFN